MGVLPRSELCQGAVLQNHSNVSRSQFAGTLQCLLLTKFHSIRIVRDYELKLVNPNKEWEWAAYFTLVPRDWPVYLSKINTLA